jgi:AraC family transcriptional regulator of adaptative response/methylated-DNA-[protein]-cysteine methyltransferase
MRSTASPAGSSDPGRADQAIRDYARIERAIEFVAAHYRDQPSLQEVAAQAGLSPHHFQRMFTRWAGVSPGRFARYLTVEYAKARLEDAASVLDASYDAGLSGPSRLHDLFVSYEAMTPGEYKAVGASVPIAYGFHPSPFGEALLLATERGLCGLAFVDRDARRHALRGMQARWPKADFTADAGATRTLAARIFERMWARQPLALSLKGTNFQIRVWEALLRIPPGRVVAYQDLARHLGRPDSVRAVATAVGANPLALVIPCHRVIRKSGLITGYRWGTARKRAMLAWEAAQAEAA